MAAEAAQENLVDELMLVDSGEVQVSDSTLRLAETLGMIATICFTLQYMPQAYMNYRRKSCRGFSSTGIIIKLVGAAFLMINSYLLGELANVVLYGLFNVVQHSFFMIQLSFFSIVKSIPIPFFHSICFVFLHA